eukprot:TRINITY_DN11113_c0_g1_i1.p1 TRINITY_DN11113_c0_g1~~TRINITY_DN11113_c0_g1_i1.p1  ORF type:complete len:382 (-),score=189.32 TRINITY_DN11113_c0_g1_i1:67-1158(-)
MAAFVIFYVLMWGIQSLLIKSSKGPNGEYPYEILSVTLMIELCKLVCALLYYLTCLPNDERGQPYDLNTLFSKWRAGRYFVVPAGIYCFYNALQFVNLRVMSPSTYRVLINIRIIFSGLLFQQFFDKRLSPKQWVALVLLIIGCGVEQLGSFSADVGPMALVLITIQAFTSSMGGVYFQWLLQKKDAAQVHFMEKNIYLYFWSVLLNLMYVMLTRSSSAGGLDFNDFFRNYDNKVIVIIFIGAFGGFATSLVLRYLDVIAKEYANFIEMIFVAVGARWAFGTQIQPTLVLGIALVSCSIMLYKSGSEASHPKKGGGKQEYVRLQKMESGASSSSQAASDNDTVRSTSHLRSLTKDLSVSDDEY